jgi:hypothetical protein
MRLTLNDRSARGSSLLLVVILLGVLAAIGAAAVTLSSRERINASAKTRRDLLVACARAAQSQLWAEIGRYGSNYFASTNPVLEAVLPDGTRLVTAHYDADASGLTAHDISIVTGSGCGEDEGAKDLTNRMGPAMSNCTSYAVSARCTIPGGAFQQDRQLEVEYQFRTRM